MASPGTTYAREFSRHNLEGFLKAELDFGLTVADMAARQHPQSDEHFGRRRRNAEAAVSNIHRFKHLLENNLAKVEILTRCSELEQVISRLRLVPE